MRGNISGSLAARLSSGLFLSAIKPKVNKDPILVGNVIASVLLVILTSFALGIVAYLVGYYFFAVASTKIVLIAVLAGVLANVVEIPITLLMTFWLYK